jgi:hypothetical protein
MEVRGGGTRSLNQLFGFIFGAVYVLVGIAGFFVTSGVDFADTTGKDLLFFELNPLHNIVHLAVGALLFGAAAAGPTASRNMNILVGVVYLLVGIIGFFIIDSDADIIALNQPDNILHIVTGILALGIGLSRRTVPA